MLIQSFSTSYKDNFVHDMSSMSWNHVFDENSVTNAFVKFHDTFKNTYDASFPFMTLKKQRKK